MAIQGGEPLQGSFTGVFSVMRLAAPRFG